MKTIRIAITVLLLSAFATMTALASPINLEATIDGLQANAGGGTESPATGVATITFDDVTSVLNWTITWSDLLGDLTVAHFHGPAAAGTNAGVQVNFLSIAPGNPSIGMAVLSAAQAADLLAELWYINIHSTVFPGGEIRGQVIRAATVAIPEAGTFALLGLGLVVIGLGRRRIKG